MNDYYIKIKQNQSEIEFSTSDRVEFRERLQELMQFAGVLDKLPDLKEQKPQETPAAEEKNDFEKALEKSMAHPVEQISSNFKTDKNFKNYLERADISDSVDMIVFTAGYLAQYENKELFTLKDLNRKLVPVLAGPIGHADINEARLTGLITIMPNYVEKQALTQYVLTAKGEELYNEFMG